MSSPTRRGTSISREDTAPPATSFSAPSPPVIVRRETLCLRSVASWVGGVFISIACSMPPKIRSRFEMRSLLCWPGRTFRWMPRFSRSPRHSHTSGRKRTYTRGLGTCTSNTLLGRLDASDGLFVAASSLGTKKARGALHTAVDDVVRQLSPCRSHRVAFWPADSDPCLQVADYCTWAIQRKWERDDDRSHLLIAPKLRSEYDVWKSGEVHYY